MDNEKLGRFNWHPDPAIDFEVEVEALEGVALDRLIGFANPEDATLESRVEKAMQFRVGGDLGAINAKHALRKLDQSLKDKAALSAQAMAGGEAQPVGEAVPMPGSKGGFTMAVFKSVDVPVGTKLFARPPAAGLDRATVERCVEVVKSEEWTGVPPAEMPAYYMQIAIATLSVTKQSIVDRLRALIGAPDER